MNAAAKPLAGKGFHQLKRRALSLGAARSFEYAMQFLLPVVLARCLDTATFGEYRLLWLIVGTVLGLGGLGLPTGLYFFLPRSDAAQKRLYIYQTALFLGFCGLVAGLVVSPWNPWQPAAVAPLAKYGALVPAFVTLWGAAALLDFLPTVEERIRWQAVTTMSLSVLRLVTLSVGALATGDLRVLLWLLIALVVLKLALLLGYVVHYHGLKAPWFDRRVFARHFCHSSPFGLCGALFGFRGQADQWIVAALFSMQSFAAFSVAAVIAPVVSLFRHSVGDVFLPVMSRAEAGGDVQGLLHLNSRANLIVAALLYPLLAFTFLFAEDIITVLYTASYVEAASTMRVYSVGMAAMVVEIGSLVLLLQQGPYAVRVYLVTLFASIALSWAGATWLGLPGAAAGSVLAIYLDRVLILQRVSALTGIGIRKLQDWRGLARTGLIAALVALLAWIVVRSWFHDYGALSRVTVGGMVLTLLYSPWLLRLAREHE